MKNIITRYFDWLQKDNPKGIPDLFPELNADGETSLKGVYIVGDLTGIPLLKFATAGGARLIRKFASINDRISTKKQFDALAGDVTQRKESGVNQKGEYDFVIIGAGPAGISAALEAKKRGMSFIVLEATDRLFNTIKDFPKGKPMFYEPLDMKDDSDLVLQGATKEDLIRYFEDALAHEDIPILFNQKVSHIETLSGNKQKIHTDAGDSFVASKTIMAIGKSGNARRLGVPGENLPHVFTKLFDAGDYQHKKILVVGGGDSALESAMLLAEAGNEVTISYRQADFTRPKPGNILKCKDMAQKGSITLLLPSDVAEIREYEVDLVSGDKKITQVFDNVFILIGRQLPYEFLKNVVLKLRMLKQP